MTAISPPRAFTTPKATSAPETAVQEVTAPVADAEAELTPPYVSLYASSIIGVSLAFLIGVAVPAAMIYGTTIGLALGLFCAFWGGPSFGVMTGSARVSAWLEAHEEH